MTRTNRNLLLTWAFLAFCVASAAADSDRVRFGSSVHIGPGENAGSTVVFGGTVTNEGSVQDVVVFGGEVHSPGTVRGDVVVFGGGASLEQDVSGDVVVFGGDLHLGPNAHIHGDAVTLGGQLIQDAGSTIAGDRQAIQGPWFLFGLSGIGLIIAVALMATAPVALVLALICYAVAGQRRVETVAVSARTQTGMAFAMGLGVLLSVGVLLWFASMLHPVGWLAVLIVCIAFIVTLAMGYTGASAWVGRMVAKNAGTLGVVIIGAIILGILPFIPFLGWALFAFVFIVALGSAVLSGWGLTPDWLARRM